MEKAKAKEKGKYAEKLDAEHRARYAQKLSMIEGFDPYECPDSQWARNVELLPPLEFPNLTVYLVSGVSAYTLQEFRAYKSLEAFKQFHDGWVHDLLIFKPQNCSNTVVKAKVMHSQRLSEKPLMPWVILDDNGDVLAAHCDCMAGLAETCTHVGGLLFKIEAVVRVRQRTTVTDVAAYWMIPGNVEKVLPKVGYEINYMTSEAKKKHVDKAIGGQANRMPLRTLSVNDVYADTPQPTLEEINDFMQALHVTGDRAVTLTSHPTYCEQYKDPVKPVEIPKSLTKLRNPACDCMTDVELEKYCESVISKADVSQEEAEKIERETRGQQSCAAWYACRAGRVTASQLHNVCTFNNEKPALSTVKNVCYPQRQKEIPGAPAWGIDHEDEARSAYAKNVEEDHYHFRVEKSGFVINPDEPYMGASPDGLVDCGCCGQGTLEIKCPYKHRDVSVKQACQDRDFCLAEEDGVFTLKKSHKYYKQVQGQLRVTKAEYCDFVVWTSIDLVIVRVEPDQTVSDECHSKAKDFFVNVVLPELTAKRFTVGKTTQAVNRKRPLEQCQNTPAQMSTNNTPAQMSTKKSRNSKKQKLWCICRKTEEEDDMVCCDNDRCPIQWFHIGCIGLDCLPEEDETWFCNRCLKNETGKENV